MAETAEDIQDVQPQQPEQAGQKRNAFSELMAPKSKQSKKDDKKAETSKTKKSGGWRNALLEYIEEPEKFPTQVLRATPNTVLIKDAFPKATIHLLLLPRSPAHYDLDPRKAFEDPTFLAVIKEEAASAARLAAAELERQLSSISESTKARNDAIDAGVPPDELPRGRDFLADIRVGVHAHPSMAHLHVHIISRDMHSDKLKHRKHYNSFNTPFFIPLDDFPLAEDDDRRVTAFQNANLGKDFVCWRCGREFGNKFTQLKNHLELEFDLWKKQ